MPVPPVIQMYRYVMGSGGGLGNLLKASEEFQQTRDWVRYPTNSQTPTVNDDSRPDPNGGTTADQVGLTANTSARLQQTVTLSASTEYTFSVYARAVSGTVDFRMRNVTLKAAEVKTATTTGPDGGGFTRFTYTFTTTTAGSYELALQNDTNATAKDVIFWGAMLNQGGTALDYEYAAPTTGGSAPAPAYAGFGDAFGGVTAYYSLRQFTEAETLNAIRVRRSSDDTEQDIGFDANGDLDTTALTTFVNADVDTYTSDFSSTEDLNESNGTGAAAQSIGGVDDAYKFTLSGGNAAHIAERSDLYEYGKSYTVSFDYYIPSGQTVTGLIAPIQSGNTGSTLLNVTGSWQSVSANIVVRDEGVGNVNDRKLRFYAHNGTNTTVDADGDVFYLKNIVVTQTTADGAVTTFYDQSGNGNHATNSTESEQPLVVSGGTLVTENSKAAIQFDGVDDELEDATVSIDSTAYSAYMVTNTTGNTSRALFRNRELGGYGAQEGAAFFELSNTDTLQNTFIDDGAGNAIGIANGASVSDGQHLLSTEFTTSSAALYVDGTSTGTHDSVEAGSTPLASVSLPYINIGGARFSRPWSSTIQEIILFDSDQSTNRTGIETNINDHFSIYP